MRKLAHRLAIVVAIGISAAAADAVEIEHVVSEGGIQAWLVEDHSVPIIAVSVAFEGGAALDPAGKEGLAEMVSSLLDEGAGAIDSQGFQQLLADLSISLRFDGNKDHFQGRLRTLSRNRDKAFDLLRLALNEPRFDDEPVERIRGQILSIIARRVNDPERIAGRVFWSTVLAGHAYGRSNRGDADTVKAITVEDLRGFVDRRLARDNLTIGVVGDITPAALATLLDTTFGALPATSSPVAVPEVRAQAAGDIILVERDVPQSTVILGHQGLKRDDPDFYAAYIMNYILGGGGFTSRLHDEVREKRGLAYSVYSYLSIWDHAGLVVAGLGTANEKVQESIDVVRAEWARMRDGDVSAEDLATAKRSLTGSYALRFETTRSIARTLVGIQLAELGIDYINRRNGLIDAVTLDDIRRVAARLLDPDGLTVVIVGKPEGIKPTRTLERG